MSMQAKISGPIASGPQLSDWFYIAADGRLIVKTGRVELGQGNQTALLKMAADELGIPATDLTLEMARTDRTVNEGFTAGSMSISEGGLALRYAASALRSVLLAQAAMRLEAAVEQLDLRSGKIEFKSKIADIRVSDLLKQVSFTSKIQDYAAPRSSKQRPSDADQVTRVDLKNRIVGAPFVHDLQEDGMLYGAPVHPPSMTSVLEDFDIDVLKDRPGVVEVIRDGSFVGVVACSPFEAAEAAKFAHGLARWSETVLSPNDPMESIAGSDADAPTVFSQAGSNTPEGTVYQTEVSRPFLMHGSIGPSSAMALWQDGAVQVWTHSQGVFQLRKAISMALATEEAKITVIHHPGAGCYGHNGADDAAFDAVLMARALPGKLIKVVWSRQDEFRAAPMGPGMVTRIEAILGKDSRITQMSIDVNSAPHANRPSVNGTPNLRAAAYLAKPISPAPSTDLPLSRGGGAERNAVPGYDIPNIQVQKRLVFLPYRTSSLRALGAFTNIFAIETLMDDIAVDCGQDPIAFRLAHLSDPRARAVIEKVAAASKISRELKKMDGVGWGFSYARYKNTSGYCAIYAQVNLQDTVRVTNVYAAIDIGEVISQDGARNQIEGGIVQATSWTLKESVLFSGSTVQAETWLDYPILRFSEVPRVFIDVIDRPDLPPLGCGEVSQAPTVAAIGNAVRDALGVRVRKLPITRQSIIDAAL
jgi:nicotinate dehydrogenase subunit B